MENGRDATGIKSLNRHILEQVVAASPAALLVVDGENPELPVVYVNTAYERLTGYALDELVGHPWALLGRAIDGELAHLKAAIGCGEACRVTVPDLRKDGSSWTSEISITPLHNARGDRKFLLVSQQPVGSAESEEVPGMLPTVVEATGEIPLLQRELGRARPKSATLDRIDAATGLLRFGYFQETLRRDMAVARRDQRPVTLLVFEIVEFDVYRQTFGGKAADSCQRMIGAQIMRALRRASDLCARYDDSTLVAAVLGQEPAEIRPLAEQIAENIRQLGLHNPRGKSSRYVTARAVVIGCPAGADVDPEPIIARALADSRSTDARARAVSA